MLAHRQKFNVKILATYTYEIVQCGNKINYCGNVFGSQTQNIHIYSATLYPPTHSHSHTTIILTLFKENSLKEGEEVDELSLGDAEREDGLHLLCSALHFSLGARNEGLSQTKLEDVPQVVL